MLDSDTIPVDHAGNSEGGKSKGPPTWVIGMVAPPVVCTAGAYAQSNGNSHTTLVGLGAGVGLSIAWVGWLALQDARRVSLARRLQDQIEDAWTAHAKGESQRAEELLKDCVKLSGAKLGRYDLVTLAACIPWAIFTACARTMPALTPAMSRPYPSTRRHCRGTIPLAPLFTPTGL